MTRFTRSLSTRADNESFESSDKREPRIREDLEDKPQRLGPDRKKPAERFRPLKHLGGHSWAC